MAPVAQPNVAPPAHAPNAALLIDFDNVTMGIRSDLQEELKNLLSSLEVVPSKATLLSLLTDPTQFEKLIKGTKLQQARTSITTAA